MPSGSDSGVDRGNGASDGDKRLPRRRRVTRSGEFAQAYEQGRKIVGRYMVAFLRSGAGAALRLGVVTSRKVGGAVERNRARRRIREVFRHARSGLSGNVDLILVARAARPEPSMEDLMKDFLSVARRAGLLAGEFRS